MKLSLLIEGLKMWYSTRACAICSDLASLKKSPWPKQRPNRIWSYLPDEYEGWEYEDSLNIDAAIGSEHFTAELVPLLCLDGPLNVHFESQNKEGFRNPLKILPQFHRFSETKEHRHCGRPARQSLRGLPDQLSCELQRCKVKGAISRKLASLVLAVSRRSSDVAQCEALLRSYQDWFDDWLENAFVHVGFWSDANGGIVSKHRNWAVETAIAALIPLSEVAVLPSQVYLGTLSPAEAIANFKPVIQPGRNIALPPVYRRYRTWLNRLITEIITVGDDNFRCDAFELWCRLNPTPFDLIFDFLRVIEEACWFKSLNEYQLCRVGLLLSNVIECIPADSAWDKLRDQISERLVSWLDCSQEKTQYVARCVLLEICDWRCSRRHSWHFLAKAPKEIQAQVHAHRDEKSDKYVTTMLSAATATWDDPIHQILRGSTNLADPQEGNRLWPDKRFNVGFEAAVLRAIAVRSENELARIKASWDLSCLAVADQRLANVAYHTFHASRRPERSAASTMSRRFLRESISGFLQDFGPVNSADGRTLEQAANNIRFMNNNYRNLMCVAVQRRTGAPREQAEEKLEEFFQDVLVHPQRCKCFADLDVRKPTALSLVITVLDRYLIDDFRRRRKAKVGIEGLEIMVSNDIGLAEDVCLNHAQLSIDVVTGLRQLDPRIAAAAFYRGLCQCSRHEAADLLRITEFSLDQLLRGARNRSNGL